MSIRKAKLARPTFAWAVLRSVRTVLAVGLLAASAALSIAPRSAQAEADGPAWAEMPVVMSLESSELLDDAYLFEEQSLGAQATANVPPIRMLSSRWTHTCALTREGLVYCWGSNYNGRLGDGTEDRNYAVPMFVRLPGGARATIVAAGGEHSCAATQAGQVYCWGDNSRGQLGVSGITKTPVPRLVLGLNNVIGVTAGWFHTCALTDNNQIRQIYCWGDNYYGQLGTGQPGNTTTPRPVNIPGSVTRVVAGANHTCARTADGRAYCWGANGSGQLGIGTTTDARTPQLVGALSNVEVLAAGKAHTCARTSANQMFCWGANEYGQLGNGSRTNASTPQPVFGLTGVAGLATGGEHTCARVDTGQVFCWGRSNYGQTGSNVNFATTPQPVNGIGNAVAIVAGDSHSCAAVSDGRIFCWGNERGGRLGNLFVASSDTSVWQPQQVGGWASPPVPFDKLSPVNGATQRTRATLTWDVADGIVDHYRFCISTANGCVPDRIAGNRTGVTISGLTLGATYYWQVRACADIGCAIFTDARGGHWSFRVVP